MNYQFQAEEEHLKHIIFSQGCNTTFRQLAITNTTLIRVIHGCKTVQDEIGLNTIVEPGRFVYLKRGEKLLISNKLGAKGTYTAEGICLPNILIKKYVESRSKLSIYSNDNRSGLMPEDFKEAFSYLAQSISSVSLPPSFLEHRTYEILMWLEHAGVSHLLFPTDSCSRRLREIIQIDIERSWKSADAAKKMNMSESTLRRKLALESTSFSEQLKEVRLSFALTKIQTTKYPLSYIALESGFSSQSRLSEAFKLRFGMSPNKLRVKNPY